MLYLTTFRPLLHCCHHCISVGDSNIKLDDESLWLSDGNIAVFTLLHDTNAEHVGKIRSKQQKCKHTSAL